MVELWIYNNSASRYRKISFDNSSRLFDWKEKDDLLDFKNGFMYLFIWVLMIAGLIFIQPNVSSAALIVIISISMLYVGGARFKHIFVSGLSVILAAGSFAMILPHSRKRILSFIASFGDGGELSHQLKQGVLSLGSGGILELELETADKAIYSYLNHTVILFLLFLEKKQDLLEQSLYFYSTWFCLLPEF